MKNVGMCVGCGRVHEDPLTEEMLLGGRRGMSMRDQSPLGMLLGGGSLSAMMNMLGIEVLSDTTAILVGTDGTVKKIRQGQEYRQVALHPEVGVALAEMVSLQREIETNRRQAQLLRRQAQELTDQARVDQVILTDDLKDLLPASDRNDDYPLTLGSDRDTGKPFIFINDRPITELSTEQSDILRGRQQAIDSAQEKAREHTAEAVTCEEFVERKPERLEALQTRFERELYRRHPELEDRRIRVTNNSNGMAVVEVLTDLDEQSDELSDDDRAVIALMANRNGHALPEPVAKLLGIDTHKQLTNSNGHEPTSAEPPATTDVIAEQPPIEQLITVE